MNRGAEQLREKLAAHGSKKVFADWIGIEPAQLSHWLGGSRKPDTKQRARIEDEHQIGWRSWDDETADGEASESTGGEAA